MPLFIHNRHYVENSDDYFAPHTKFKYKYKSFLERHILAPNFVLLHAYNINDKGHNMDPGGTPDVTLVRTDSTPLILISLYKVLFCIHYLFLMNCIMIFIHTI